VKLSIPTNRDHLAKVYQTKTDEELLQLALLLSAVEQRGKAQERTSPLTNLSTPEPGTSSPVKLSFVRCATARAVLRRCQIYG